MRGIFAPHGERLSNKNAGKSKDTNASKGKEGWYPTPKTRKGRGYRKGEGPSQKTLLQLFSSREGLTIPVGLQTNNGRMIDLAKEIRKNS